jgi:hypothetical protein
MIFLISASRVAKIIDVGHLLVVLWLFYRWGHINYFLDCLEPYPSNLSFQVTRITGVSQ